tara:strand:+ start:593 stop:1396 length:804 start_codon:yes stop_codon:yes gene_type:complete
MKKILIIGKRGFIGNYLYKYLKKSFHLKKISFKDLKKFENKLNNFDFIINSSINENYILKKYNEKFDNDYKISKFIDNQRTIYCFISTRKVYPSKANLKEKSKLSPKSHYSKNKLITEGKISKKLKKNFLILRVSNIIGDTKISKRIHHTFIDVFQKNINKGIVFDNERVFKDFLSIDKFCQILKEIIRKKLTGIYNISIGQKVYLNDLIGWLNKFNNKKYKIKKNVNLKKESFYLNNRKLMSKIKIQNSLNELRIFCLKYSKKKFS